MAIAINEHYLNSFIGKVQARYESLDRELQEIAAASQRAYRSDLQPGQTVRDLKRTTVYEERYQEQANDAELTATVLLCKAEIEKLREQVQNGE